MDARTDKQTNGRTHDGHNTMTIARWPLASGANESPIKAIFILRNSLSLYQRNIPAK